MDQPRWLSRAAILAMHDEQIAEHGGAAGIRDESLLDSALGRPVNLFLYEQAALPRLAAAYGFGIIRNHPFIDGNKRASLLATEGFLLLNGFEIDADDAMIVRVWLDLAAGGLDEEQFAMWVAAHIGRS
jgi:death on curing protein